MTFVVEKGHMTKHSVQKGDVSRLNVGSQQNYTQYIGSNLGKRNYMNAKPQYFTDAHCEVNIKKIESNDSLNHEIAIALHECNVCKLVFKEKSELAAHMMTHKNSEILKFSKDHPGETPFIVGKLPIYTDAKCSEPGTHNTSGVRTQRDLVVGPKECHKPLLQSSLGEKSVVFEKSVSKLECDLCHLTFEKITQLKEHVAVAHGNETSQLIFKTKDNTVSRAYTCSSCGEGFDDEFNFIRHICDTSDDAAKGFSSTGRKTYICITCDKVFLRKQLLTIHERKHTGETPYKCATCDKSFAAKNSLTKHEMIHTGEKPCVCNVCGKAFGRSGTLTVHMRLHTGEKPFKCRICNEGFTTRQLLVIHERKHSGEKPFKCKTCGKNFITRNTLNKHEMIHTGEKPFICTVCAKAFARNGTLNVHMRAHTGDTPYKCTFCKRPFVNNVGLKYHIATVHAKE